MTTEAYASAFYGFIYGQLGLAKQDNIRFDYGEWLERLVSTDFFLIKLQQAAGCIA